MTKLPKFKTYCVFAVLMGLLILLAWVLSPFLAALSVALGVNRLPLGLQWFSTVDDTLDGGQKQHPDKYPADARGVSLWWQRTCWICRNPAQGFGIYAFGYPMTSSYMASEVKADGITTKIYVLGDGERIFSYQRNIPLWGKTYAKIWFGWARKTNILRYSLKVVPFSFGTQK
ncbi:hypothetical protein EVB71_007 [Rhizobium phage RHph_Y55]|nr:hypothetical protein EVB71_007 [Rhizobium phage RHph_Y55]